MTEDVYLELFIVLNVKDSIKGTRVLTLIQKELGVDMFVEELYRSDDKEFGARCFVKCSKLDPNILIADTIILLSKLGENWSVRRPNLDHEEYWKFKGERKTIPQHFKVNGIQSIDFELTNYKRDRSDIEFILQKGET